MKVVNNQTSGLVLEDQDLEVKDQSIWEPGLAPKNLIFYRIFVLCLIQIPVLKDLILPGLIVQ